MANYLEHVVFKMKERAEVSIECMHPGFRDSPKHGLGQGTSINGAEKAAW